MRKTTAWLRGASALLLLLAWAACGDGERGRGALAALGVDDGASRGVSKSVEVSSNKGGHIALSTGAALDVPMGAVDKNVKLAMERPEDSKAAELVGRFKKDQDRIVSAPYVLTPHGTKFKEDVSVTLPVNKSDAREVSVAWLEDENDEEWKLLAVATKEGKTAEVKLKHFSVLVLVEDASDLPVVMDTEPEPSGKPDAEVAGDDASTLDTGTEMRADAGDIDPEADAGYVDAGADAGVGPRMDASTGEGRDAAPIVPDTGVVPDPDAGDDEPDVEPPPPDASVVADASVPGDGGQEAGAGGAAFALQSMYAKLAECGAVAQTGTFSDQLHNDPLYTCIYTCMAQGECTDALGMMCDISTDGGSPGAQACVTNCVTFVCPNQQLAVRCNETQECANGEDEQACGGFFTCGTMTLSYDLRCNGMPECPDQSDEVGCFTCDQNTTVLKPEQQCDGLVDCYDFTDEPTTCAAIACPAPG